ncbi:RDD family protein [Granulosicoccus antarcticus]|uniref:RDD domain-containing protein n=1 Tax=Granulosicoccus antarcticus IMCC3135 TaxID=1192854 RepID=A0A2Z2NUQ5_9GAMM|nr:RDD family protein [Granulosicoccus antarcticus]ASJ75049.1 hypothetical protein IMCC3135_24925 [Granulosicoccus antarcticus IMCC3135]
MQMENVKPTLSLMFRRAASFLYDGLLLIAIFFIITAIAIAFNHGHAIQSFAFYLFLFIVAFLFFDWFWRHGGQTLGMRAWRLRVEALDSETITLKQSVARYLTGFLLFGISLLYMPFSKQGLALHDSLSRTKIIKYYK